AAKTSAVRPLRAAEFAGEPDGSCMARIVDKFRCPGKILPARWRDFERRRSGPKPAHNKQNRAPPREVQMAITAPQGLSRDSAGIAAATRVRWTYIAPTLLVYWIMSMFDKSNISIVIANPKFLDELGLAGQTKELGWLVGSLFISYGIAAPVWGWIVTRYGPRNPIMARLVICAATCFWSGLSESYGMLLASRIGLGAGEAACYPVTLALVANWFALRERGKAPSYWWIGTMIGPMLPGLLVTGLIVYFGWRGQFYVL